MLRYSLNSMARKGMERTSGRHGGRVLDEKDGFRVIECSGCRFKHLDPIPSALVLDEFYNRSYYQSHKIDYLDKESREEAYLRIAYGERLDSFSRWAPGRDLLDVGCGSGSFLRFALERGWNAVGIEPSDEASRVARQSGLEVHSLTLEEFWNERSRSFHVIHLKNVLEHVPDPARILSMCRDMLADEGVLYVEVPNDYDFVQRVGIRIARQRKSWIAIPDHINYFSFRSAEALMRRNGFELLMRDATFPMYVFLWFGMDFIASKEAGAAAHRIRVGMETFLHRCGLNFIKRAAYRLLAALSLGRTAILYCRKMEYANA
jgi:2-polyprenyl-3-methyl-5-hydroxy-6-metoxy-1,4-benzoquinol methylase